ncbi:MAG: YcxB family protein [bacterium]|nr:YcxB family protein [bacterium]
MKLKFEYTKDDYKKYLIKSRRINNIVLFIIGIVVYLFLTLNKVSIYFLPIFIIGLIIVIYLLNLLYVFAQLKVCNMLNYNTIGNYTLELTPNKFSVTLNKSKTDYKYNNIKKIVEHKSYFTIKLNKTRDSLTFEKNKFTEKDYIDMLEYFKNKIK